MFEAAGNKQEGQIGHHYRLIPDGFSSVLDIEGNESVTASHRFLKDGHAVRKLMFIAMP